VEATDPAPAPDEVKEITWMETSELRRLIDESPERIFTFQLPVLEFYLHQCTET
jgi:isopentenyldiphosphate isomerase